MDVRDMALVCQRSDQGLLDDPEWRVSHREMRDSIKRNLRYLTPIQEDIVERSFGLNGHQEQTLKQIGDTVKLSRARVGMIRSVALKRLRISAYRDGLSEVAEMAIYA